MYKFKASLGYKTSHYLKNNKKEPLVGLLFYLKGYIISEHTKAYIQIQTKIL